MSEWGSQASAPLRVIDPPSGGGIGEQDGTGAGAQELAADADAALREGLVAAAGFSTEGPALPPLYSPGVDVEVFPLGPL